MGYWPLLFGAFYLGVIVYVLILLTGMARNIAKQSASLERIARALEREPNRDDPTP